MGIISNILEGGLGGKIADIVSKVIPDKDLAAKMAHEVEMALMDKEQEIKKLVIETESTADTQQQETIRAELAQSDEYTKRTRPLLVRRSWWVSAGYVGISIASKLLPQVQDIEVDWSILTLLMSPVLTYFGVRTFDKWKLGK